MHSSAKNSDMALAWDAALSRLRPTALTLSALSGNDENRKRIPDRDLKKHPTNSNWTKPKTWGGMGAPSWSDWKEIQIWQQSDSRH